MDLIRVLFIGLFVSFNPHIATAEDFGTCAEIAEKGANYIAKNLKGATAKDIIEASKGGPIERLQISVFDGLDPKYLLRVNSRFLMIFSDLCRKSPAQKAEDVAAQVIRIMRLDKSAPNWGLKEINTERMLNTKCNSVSEIRSEYRKDSGTVNDPWPVMLEAFWSTYDVEDAGQLDKVVKVRALFPFECRSKSNSTIREVLETLAAQEGLKKLK